MVESQPIQRAARILHSGGVVAYPTEGVFGLGCLPDNAAAVSRILEIKERDPAMGLALIAADLAQLNIGYGSLKAAPRCPPATISP